MTKKSVAGKESNQRICEHCGAEIPVGEGQLRLGTPELDDDTLTPDLLPQPTEITRNSPFEGTLQWVAAPSRLLKSWSVAMAVAALVVAALVLNFALTRQAGLSQASKKEIRQADVPTLSDSSTLSPGLRLSNVEIPAWSSFDVAFLKVGGTAVVYDFAVDHGTDVSPGLGSWEWIDWIKDGQEIAVQEARRVVAIDPRFPDKPRTLVELGFRPKPTVVSPTGNLVAVVRLQTRALPRTQIVVAATGAEYDVASDSSDLFWSHDEKTLAIFSYRIPEKQNASIKLYNVRDLVSASAADASKRAPSPTVSIDFPVHPSGWVYPAISPDEKLIAVAFNGDDGTRQIGLITIVDQSLQQVTDNGLPNLMPSFSPDGRFLSYLRGRAAPYEVAVMDLQTKEESILANNAMLARPAWRRRPPPDEPRSSRVPSPP